VTSTDGSRPSSSISATREEGDTTTPGRVAPPASTDPCRRENEDVSDRLPVLIVDDQAPFRAAMRAVLRRTTEFELVGEAASGNEAISLAEQLHPVLVLMDINMPEMNGIEATRTLVSRQPGVVVILCSTYDAGDLPPEVATSGARAYLNKEHLGADTLRRLWDERDQLGFTSV
jgi:CheY-like chemotaxis protein